MRLVELLLVLIMEGRKALPKTSHLAGIPRKLDSFSGDRNHRQVSISTCMYCIESRNIFWRAMHSFWNIFAGYHNLLPPPTINREKYKPLNVGVVGYREHGRSKASSTIDHSVGTTARSITDIYSIVFTVPLNFCTRPTPNVIEHYYSGGNYRNSVFSTINDLRFTQHYIYYTSVFVVCVCRL